jgi:hypothetical protein
MADNADDDDDLTEQDRAALALAIKMKRSFGKEDREQIDAFLAGERKAGFPDEWAVPPRPWREVAEFAVYGCQMRNLNLRPAQCPPVWHNAELDLDRNSPFNNSVSAARALARRMEAAGISIYHPDPEAALAARQAKPA